MSIEQNLVIRLSIIESEVYRLRERVRQVERLLEGSRDDDDTEDFFLDNGEPHNQEDYEPMPNYSDDHYEDGQALASAGMGTDEDYGYCPTD